MTLQVHTQVRRGWNGTKPRAETVRCAVYCRQSVEDRSGSEFTSIDNQRESVEAYIRSQREKGWKAIATRYDDEGISGATLKRPALQRLLDDVRSGKVDCVLVYRYDRLSRSPRDFLAITDELDRHGVTFVSVTEHFNTATPAGKMMLHMIVGFAEFERETIRERVRDKVHAARRRGRWIGGTPPLGYDVHPDGGRLVVNRQEAKQVVEVFRLYLDLGSILPVVQELHRRGWTTKAWTSKTGNRCGGKPISKNWVNRTLKNVVYIGKVAFKGEVLDGEHDAIADEATFAAVQDQLRRNGPDLTGAITGSSPALLRGLLRCGHCDKAMVPKHTTRGPRRYRYYVCRTTKDFGFDACPTKSIPAGEIERFVIEELAGYLADVSPADADGLQNGSRAAVVRGWIDCVVYDRGAGRVTITFRDETA